MKEVYAGVILHGSDRHVCPHGKLEAILSKYDIDVLMAEH